MPQIEVRHRLRIAREYAGLEQSELADLIGVSRNTVGNAEKGRGEPRRIMINAWALACGVPASWILTGDPAPDSGPGGGGGRTSPNKPVGYIRPKVTPRPLRGLDVAKIPA